MGRFRAALPREPTTWPGREHFLFDQGAAVVGRIAVEQQRSGDVDHTPPGDAGSNRPARVRAALACGRWLGQRIAAHLDHGG
ncbi:hypothetical protein K7G98_22170 [Saccharothrix sp. MB29]|nr:hypothetical protein [Saccharothrix sp. MB29]